MIKTIRPSLLFFYLAYTFILLQAMFNNVPSLTPLYGIIDKLVIVLIFLTILFQNQIYRIKEIAWVVIIFAIVVISYFLSKDNIILKAIMLIIASKDINFKKFIKFDLVIKVIFCFIIIIFSQIGIAENYVILRADGTIRQSLGFSHPNALAAYWLSICCDYIYLAFNKNKIIKLFICTIITFIIGYITDSRTVIICVSLMIILLLYNNYLNNKIIKKIVIFLPYLLFALSLSLAYLYKSSDLIKNIDRLLSKRIYYTEQYLQKYDINLFGQKIETVSTVQSRLLNISPQILDNSYIVLLLKFGIILLFCSCLLLSLRLKLSYRERDKLLIIILIIFMIVGLFENWLIKINYNPFILSFSSLIYRERKKIDSIKFGIKK
ncbi:putative uncharacterized protein [Clostridium sp. CAG:221]|uniref:hypothetical protein n=1 Tax=Clostridium sp. CAG:221 TaxID=1262780 RepID=UPI000335E0BD|nr:hypothetical protein [Clostridium sp. CAG:221]CDB16979.1 putative uncharacterized protein [Clostridium sp. CAG:221]